MSNSNNILILVIIVIVILSVCSSSSIGGYLQMRQGKNDNTNTSSPPVNSPTPPVNSPTPPVNSPTPPVNNPPPPVNNPPPPVNSPPVNTPPPDVYAGFSLDNNSIKNKVRDNFCLDVINSRTDDGAQIIAWDCSGNDNQNWSLDEKQRIVNINSGKCLGTVNSNVVQWGCHDDLNQKWLYDNNNKLHPKNEPNKCLDITNNSTQNGANVIVSDCNNNYSQKWESINKSNNIKLAGQSIKNKVRDNFCLDVINSRTDDGAQIIAWDCSGKFNQQWSMDDKQRIVSSISGKCLGTVNSNVVQWGCHDGLNQKWVIDNNNRLHPKNEPNKCLDISNKSTQNGANVIVSDCNNDNSQKWDPVIKFNDSVIKNNNLCVDVTNGSKDNDAQIILWECKDQDNQKWSIDDKQRLVNKNSGKCLGTVDSKVVQWSCHDGDNQKWIFDYKKRLHSKNAQDKCLDVTNSSSTKGAILGLNDCKDYDSQKWDVNACTIL